MDDLPLGRVRAALLLVWSTAVVGAIVWTDVSYEEPEVEEVVPGLRIADDSRTRTLEILHADRGLYWETMQLGGDAPCGIPAHQRGKPVVGGHVIQCLGPGTLTVVDGLTNTLLYQTTFS